MRLKMWLDRIKEWLCNPCLDLLRFEVVCLENKLKNNQEQHDRELAECSEHLSNKEKELEEVKTKLEEYTKVDEQADYWNNKWAKNKLTYKAQGKYKRDPRTLIVTKSHILQKYADQWKNLDHDDIALKALHFVIDKITYKGDLENYKEAEYWQHPEITWQMKSGDCEDGSLLMASLIRMVGVPAYKVKVGAGTVYNPYTKKKGGHAYTIYLADDDEWYVLDWCFFPKKSISNFKKIPHSDQVDVYLDIWWTFNDEWCWVQHSTIIK